jgi:predicted HAD superfamily Cof-like phosphohydrolase
MDLQHSSNTFTGLDEAHARFLRMHQELGLPAQHHPQPLGSARAHARATWIRAEVDELLGATGIVDQIDALMDILSHVMGTLVEMGVPPGMPMTCVHESNLAKRWPDGQVRLDLDGKLLKPPGWKGPEEAIARWLAETSRQNWDSKGNPPLKM